MRVENLFGAALKETPAEAELASHQLLLRAGYVRPLGAGIYTALPLAWRSLRKIEAILREEMDRIGGQELCMPVVHPAEVWQASGRWSEVGPEMVRLKDRRDSDLVLAMTHEEVVAWHTVTEVQSYRQLPMMVYHLQTKFRDEPRSRGGLIRVREFVMKDAYSLDRDHVGLEAQYEAQHEAYLRIFARCSLPVVYVDSDTGMMGGQAAREYMFVSDIGEDHLVLCDGCDYAANREVATYTVPPTAGEQAPLEEVATPGAKTIAELAAFIDVPTSQTAKVVLYVASFADEDRTDEVVMALVRGDMEANDIAVGRAVGAAQLRPAEATEIEPTGAVAGYASPVGLDRDKLLIAVDAAVAVAPALVAGANREGYHLLNTRYGRDYTAHVVAPLALAPEGSLCTSCGAALRHERGVEVGNIFQLGTRYTEAVGATFLDETGREKPVVMGSYGIGVGRLLACVAEAHHDEAGLAWPAALAPFQVYLVALARKPEAKEAAQALYDALRSKGVDVLLDDRKKVSPGVKFAEADLRGMPLRVVVSDRGMKQDEIELKRRSGGEAWTVPAAAAVSAILEALSEAQS